MDFTDIASRYLQNRFDTATQPFTDPGGYLENRMGVGGETEEERRRRLEKEAQERANREIGSTTIKNYADGSQEEVIKKQVPAPAAPEMPVAPPPVAQVPAEIAAPVMAPVNPQQPVAQPQVNPLEQAPAPTVIPRQLATEQQRQIDAVLPPVGQGPVTPPMSPAAVAPAPAMQPVAAPVAPQARPIINDQGQVLGRETPEQMVAGAQVNAPVAAGPVAPTAPVAQPAVAPAPVAPVNPAAPPTSAVTAPTMEQAGPPTSLMTPGGWQDRITTAKSPADFESIMTDPNTPSDIRRAAAKRFSKSTCVG